MNVGLLQAESLGMRHKGSQTAAIGGVVLTGAVLLAGCIPSATAGGVHAWVPFTCAPSSSIKPPAFLSPSFLQLLLPHKIMVIQKRSWHGEGIIKLQNTSHFDLHLSMLPLGIHVHSASLHPCLRASTPLCYF